MDAVAEVSVLAEAGAVGHVGRDVGAAEGGGLSEHVVDADLLGGWKSARGKMERSWGIATYTTHWQGAGGLGHDGADEGSGDESALHVDGWDRFGLRWVDECRSVVRVSVKS